MPETSSATLRHGLRSRAAGRSGAVLVLGAALVMAGTTPAWAHHVDLVAAADCGGTVRWSMQSWVGEAGPADPTGTLSRSNAHVTVSWSTDGVHFTDAPDPAVLADAGSYTATGVFRLPPGTLPARLQVRAIAGPWGNGVVDATPRPAPAIDLSDCPAALAPSPASPSSARSDVGGSGGAPRLPITLGGGLAGSLLLWRLTRRARP